MVPKPFPYPLGIGVDVCKVNRIAQFLRNDSLRNRWARKIFTRLEWPALWSVFLKTQRATTGRGGGVNGKDWTAGQRSYQSFSGKEFHSDDSIWMLPVIPDALMSRDATVGGNDPEKSINNERSPIGLLARHLAGR